MIVNYQKYHCNIIFSLIIILKALTLLECFSFILTNLSHPKELIYNVNDGLIIFVINIYRVKAVEFI